MSAAIVSESSRQGRSSVASNDWHSVWKPVFDLIVEKGPPPHQAVVWTLEFQERHGYRAPRFYVSTAISSAGWRRHPDYRDPERISEAIARNNRSASLVLGELVTDTASFVTEESMMVPTDLGKVPEWKDTHYLLFYFSWLAGLNGAGAERFTRSFEEDQYTDILSSTNNRKLTNEQRWPWYQLFAEIALTKLRLVESLPNTRTGEEADVLLQLIDVDESLGCRAERLFADARELDIIIPTFGDRLASGLKADVENLRDLGASVGAARTEIELIPIKLR